MRAVACRWVARTGRAAGGSVLRIVREGEKRGQATAGRRWTLGQGALKTSLRQPGWGRLRVLSFWGARRVAGDKNRSRKYEPGAPRARGGGAAQGVCQPVASLASLGPEGRASGCALMQIQRNRAPLCSPSTEPHWPTRRIAAKKSGENFWVLAPPGKGSRPRCCAGPGPTRARDGCDSRSYPPRRGGCFDE